MKHPVKLFGVFIVVVSIISAFQNCAPSLDVTDADLSSVQDPAPTDTGPIIQNAPGTPTYVDQGQPVYFTAIVAGQNLTFQWFKDDIPVPGATSVNFQGPAQAQLSDSGTYKIVVNGLGGQTQHQFGVIVNPATGPTPTPGGPTPTPGQNNGAPTVVTPVNSIKAQYTLINGVYNYWNPAKIVGPGPTYPDYNLAQFDVVASGSGLSYQWYFINSSAGSTTQVDIPGANTPTLKFIINNFATQLGTYGVRINNSKGGVISQNAMSFPSTAVASSSVAVGPGGGTSFTSTCPTGSSVIGFTAHHSSSGMVYGLQPRCGNPTFIKTANQAGGTFYGTSLPLDCPAGTYVIGVNTKADNSGLTFLQAICGSNTGLNITQTLGAGNFNAGTSASFSCPTGHVVKGISGKLGTYTGPFGTVNYTYFKSYQVNCGFALP